MTIRAVTLGILIAAFVTATTVAGQSTARLSYPFLEAGPLRAPAILYLPSYYPAGTEPLRLMFGPNGAGFDFEMRQTFRSGDELIVWESTRYDATVRDAVGAHYDVGEVPGALTTWTVARGASGATIIHARIGQTLVVIAGPISEAELLRVADSLRRGSPQSLML